MSRNRLPELFKNRLLGFLAQLVASDWISLVIQAWRFLTRFLGQEVYPGMYEILDYDAVLELKDTRGRTAVFRRRQKVKFLHDNIVALQDQVWGDGEPLAGYKCSPGVAVDRYKHGFKQIVLISLRETKGRGDILEFNTERKIRDGFARPDEWFQIELNFKTRRLRLAVIFPKTRHCQRAILVERNRNRSTVLDQDRFSLLPDGRQMLSWEVTGPPTNELYTLKWRW
jgi:hypothetical protein